MDTGALLAEFNGLIAKYKLELKVNENPGKLTGIMALDVEHDECGTFVGVGFTLDGHTIYYFNNLLVFASLDFTAASLVCHNGRTDIDVLRQWGIDVKDNQLYWDTESIAHLIDSRQGGYGLKDLSQRVLGIAYADYETIVGKHKTKTKASPACPRIKSDCCGRITLDKQPPKLVAMYNAMDVFVAWKLYEQQTKGQRGTPPSLETPAVQYFNQVEKPISFILQAMENRGVCIDLPYLRELKQELESQIRPLEARIFNEFGNINLDSPQQLLGALKAKGFDPRNRKGPSTDKEAIAGLPDSPLKADLQARNEIETLLSVFVNRYLLRNATIVHPWFNQCGTRTGRLSCSNPNLLQIPKRSENGKLVRRMFIPRPGMRMGDCDFGQIEPRILAHFSKDSVLCKMFNDGIDFHEFTASRLGISRDRAKILNLSVGYRATKYSVSRQLGGTLDEAQQEIDKWWALFPELRRWQDQLLYASRKSGSVTTLLGRRIGIDGLDDPYSWRRESAERQAINNITQGSAAEVMKLAMIRINAIYPHIGLLVQVYDELVFEASANMIDVELKAVKGCMEHAIKLAVPLTVDGKSGKNWVECH